MRFEITYSETIWTPMPDPAAEADDLWIVEQRSRYESGPLAGMAHLIEASAREALARRRTGVDSSFFFRPLDLAVTGVLHATVLDFRSEGALDPVALLPPGISTLLEPVVTPFETDAALLGQRVVYVADRADANGEYLGGVAYGFAIDDASGYVFSELARTDSIGLMLAHADSIVGSMQLVA